MVIFHSYGLWLNYQRLWFLVFDHIENLLPTMFHATIFPKGKEKWIDI